MNPLPVTPQEASLIRICRVRAMAGLRIVGIKDQYSEATVHAMILDGDNVVAEAHGAGPVAILYAIHEATKRKA